MTAINEDAWGDLGDDLDLQDIAAKQIGEFSNLPEGVYKAVVTKFDRWANDEIRAMRFFYEVTDGPHKGEVYTDFQNIPHEPDDRDRALGFVKGRFEALGVPKDWSKQYTEDLIIGQRIVFILKEREGKKGTKNEGKTFVNLTSVALDLGDSAAEGPAKPEGNPFGSDGLDDLD